MRALAVTLCIVGVISGSSSSPAAEPEPKPHFLSTNEPSFFCLDHGSGSTYYRFDPQGTFQEIAREHMGVMPLGSGIWTQAVSGPVTLHYENPKGIKKQDQEVKPTAYKEKVFLVWPEKSYASNTHKVIQKIDDPAGKSRVYNEFMITGTEFTNGTSSPHPFRYVKPRKE